MKNDGKSHCFFSIIFFIGICVSLFFIIFHCFFLSFSPCFIVCSLFFIMCSCFCSLLFIIFHCFFSLFHHLSFFFFYLFHFFHCFFHYCLLFFNVFQLFNVVFELLIRLKNTKTDKIEYFRDPGVTWLQIIYLEAFHCVDFFPYVSLFLLCFFHIPGVSDKTNNFAR